MLTRCDDRIQHDSDAKSRKVRFIDEFNDNTVKMLKIFADIAKLVKTARCVQNWLKIHDYSWRLVWTRFCCNWTDCIPIIIGTFFRNSLKKFIFVRPNIKWGTASCWLLCPNSAWGSIDTIDIGKTHLNIDSFGPTYSFRQSLFMEIHLKGFNINVDIVLYCNIYCYKSWKGQLERFLVLSRFMLS